jgi:hypothetical protein
MTRQVLILFLLLSIQKSKCSFWNDIPSQCFYDQTALLSCSNATFTRPIPLFNDLTYTFQNHRVEIRDSYIQLALYSLFSHVGSNIENLTLIDNRFLSLNESGRIYFRLLQILSIHDQKGLQWFQLKSSYFPQLIQLDLSYNQFTNQDKLVLNLQLFPT